VDSTASKSRTPRRPTGLLGQLYREAAVRWIMLGIAVALLISLGILAGRVRDPHAVKRQWAVTASRILALTGGLVITRLLLVSYEERVPIVLFDLRSAADPDRAVHVMHQAVDRLRAKGYEVVAIEDIIEFISGWWWKAPTRLSSTVRARPLRRSSSSVCFRRGLWKGFRPPVFLQA
jgi:hypothetical protein